MIPAISITVILQGVVIIVQAIFLILVSAKLRRRTAASTQEQNVFPPLEMPPFTMPRDRKIVTVEELVALVKDLNDCLESLVSLQNGPPLAKYEDKWNDTMMQAEHLMERVETLMGEVVVK